MVPDIAELDVLLDRFVGVDFSAYADGESVLSMHRILARVEAVTTEMTAAFDAAGSWAPDGARSAAAWLRTTCRLPGSEARRRVRRGRALRHLPACATAWQAGDITGAHVDAVAQVRTPVTEEALARDEATLVEQATDLKFQPFLRILAYWKQLADPDGAEHDAETMFAKRSVFLSASFDGTWLGDMTLDPISGTIVATELARLEKVMFEADWASATAGLDHEPEMAKLPRTSAQRRADALVEMATRSRCTPAGARRPEPLFTVLVGYETLHGRCCELANRMVVSPGSLLRYLDQALVERVVFAPGVRPEVSATARFFTGATRRAIEIRDRECTHPFCDESAPGRLQVDHIVPFVDGGPTVQENGRLLCGVHNRQRNRREPPDRE